MAAIRSKLDSRSAEFQANAREMAAKVADLRAVVERIAQGGDEAARAKHTARGKLLPRERLRLLLLALAISASLNAPIGETKFGVFRM